MYNCCTMLLMFVWSIQFVNLFVCRIKVKEKQEFVDLKVLLKLLFMRQYVDHCSRYKFVYLYYLQSVYFTCLQSVWNYLQQQLKYFIQDDRLMFALHLVHGIHGDKFGKQVHHWEYFISFDSVNVMEIVILVWYIIII